MTRKKSLSPQLSSSAAADVLADNNDPSSNNNNNDDDDNTSVLDMSEQTNRPPDVALHQQRIPAWMPILDPIWAISALLYLGIILVPVGEQR